jgi:hypothetical protein
LAAVRVVGGIELGRVFGLVLGMAVVEGLKGIEQFAEGLVGRGNGAGGIEGRGGEVAIDTDEVLVIAAEAVDGIGGGLGFGRGGGGGGRDLPGQGEGGDVEGVEGGAGAERIDAEREDALEDLRGHELDGGVVLEERNGGVARLGQGGAAIAVVGEAEVESADDFIFAAMAVGGEGAALGALGGRGLGATGIEGAGGEGNGLRQRLLGHRNSP